MAGSFLKAAQSAMSKGLKAVGLQSSGPPADEKLTRALTRLNALEKVIANMTKGFRVYADTVTRASTQAVSLSADITRFYNDNAPRLSSVKKYAESQAKVDIAATRLFDRELNFDLLPIFADWTPEVQRIKRQIQETEAARVRVFELKLKVEELRSEHKKRTDKGTASYEQSQALARGEEELKKHSAAYEVMFENADRATKEIMDNRFAAFDQCYVRLLELQLDFYKSAANAVGPLQTAVDNYRKRHPKTGYAYAASPTNANGAAAAAAEAKSAPANDAAPAAQPQQQKVSPSPSPPASQRKAPTAQELSDDELEVPPTKGRAAGGAGGGAGSGGEGPNGVASNGRKPQAQQQQPAAPVASKPPPPATAPPESAAEQERKRKLKAQADVFGALEGFDAMRGGGAEKPDPLAGVTPAGAREDDSLANLAGFGASKPTLSKGASGGFDIFGAASPSARSAAGGASNAAAAPASKPATLDDFAFFGAGAKPVAAPAPTPSPQPAASASDAMGFDFSGGMASRPAAAAAAKPAAPQQQQQVKPSAYGEFDSFLGGGGASRQSSSAAASSSSGGGAEDPDMTLPGELDGPPSEVAARAAASASPLDDLDDEPPVRRPPPQQQQPPQRPAAAAHDPDDFTSHLRGAMAVEQNAKAAAASALQEYEDAETIRVTTAEAKQAVSQALKDKLQNWEYKNGVQKGIRTLLSSMQSVLWPDSGWSPLSIGDVSDDKKLHKFINKARLLVHPDKQPSLQRGGTPERLYTAERMNEAINTAWAAFQSNPKGKF